MSLGFRGSRTSERSHGWIASRFGLQHDVCNWREWRAIRKTWENDEHSESRWVNHLKLERSDLEISIGHQKPST